MIPFSPPRIDQKIIDEVVDTLKSGWITTGPKTKLFEKKITSYCGSKSTLCVGSATAGLDLILRWFGVGKGDEVIIPAYTYCSTANVVAHCGAKIVMVDVNKDDFNISLKNIKNAITENTKVVIPVDIAGFPCDYEQINSLVIQKEIRALFIPNTEVQRKLGRILVLSDSAHAFGASYKGKKIGSITDVSVFSFHAVKNLTTAEGGAVCLNLPEPFDCNQIYNYLNICSLHGQSKDALAKSEKNSWRYDVIVNGYKSNMTDIQASMGLVELERYESETLQKRREIIEAYAEGFSKYDWSIIPPYKSGIKVSSYHLFLLRVRGITEEQRDQIIQNIFDMGVSVNVHFQPLPLLSVFKKQGYVMEDYPVAYQNFSCEISLPVYFNLTKEQIDKVINAVVISVKNIRK